jgi:hypothetical protein
MMHFPSESVRAERMGNEGRGGAGEEGEEQVNRKGWCVE